MMRRERPSLALAVASQRLRRCVEQLLDLRSDLIRQGLPDVEAEDLEPIVADAELALRDLMKLVAP
jgi:hypothetical protein